MSLSSLFILIMAFLYANTATKEIVISGKKEDIGTQSMLSIYNKHFLPFSSIMLNEGEEELYKIAPFTQNQQMIDNKATAYVCENFACHEPITNSKKLSEILYN